MKIINLLNKIADGEEVHFKAKLNGKEVTVNYYNDRDFSTSTGLELLTIADIIKSLNDEVEIIKEEKKIPEKHINNYGDLIIIGQQDNWLEPTIETDQKINAQLNPYVFEAINENFKDIENKIYEIIDYLKSKGE